MMIKWKEMAKLFTKTVIFTKDNFRKELLMDKGHIFKRMERRKKGYFKMDTFLEKEKKFGKMVLSLKVHFKKDKKKVWVHSKVSMGSFIKEGLEMINIMVTV